jgi:threonine dehydrogenase-like Zn-dependent dehydrogenase
MTELNSIFKLTEPRKIEIVEEELKKTINPEYVRICIEYCGICGTDLSIYKGLKKETYPACLGHEHCGTIIKVGKEVTQFKVGEFVAIDPNFRCGKCQYCKASYSHLCEDYISKLYSNKGFATFIDIHMSYLVSLPNYKKRYIGALVEPLSVALHALEIAKISEAKNICVIGAGGIGMLIVFSILSTFKKIELTIFDCIPEKTKSLQLLYGKNVKILSSLEEGTGKFDYVFDVAGTTQGFTDACVLLAKLGTLIIVSRYYGQEPTLSNEHLIWKEPIIKVSHFNGERKLMHEAALLLQKQWKDEFDKLIKIYPFKDIEKAFIEFEKIPFNKKIISMT